MGIIRQITCTHPEALFYEEKEELIPIPSKRKADHRKVRMIYCPDCGLTFKASKAYANDSKERIEKLRDIKSLNEK